MRLSPSLAAGALLLAAFSPPARSAEPAPLPARPTASAEVSLNPVAGSKLDLSLSTHSSEVILSSTWDSATESASFLVLEAPTTSELRIEAKTSQSPQETLARHDAGQAALPLNADKIVLRAFDVQTGRPLASSEAQASAGSWAAGSGHPSRIRIVASSQGKGSPITLTARISNLAGSSNEAALAPGVGSLPGVSNTHSASHRHLAFSLASTYRSLSLLGPVARPTDPVTVSFNPPSNVALTLGVSSKSGEARLSIYEPGAERALMGTEPEAGAVRWIGMLSKPGEHRLVVHTRGAETPVRLEVSVDRHLDFAATEKE